MRDAIARLRSSLESREGGEVTVSREDLSQLVSLLDKAMAAAERAQTLLENAYSVPDDERGIRFQSEDGVRLQWALREIGIGDDSGQPCFTV